jgi:hypothetical protein
MVPEISPLTGSMLSPEGKPVTLKVGVPLLVLATTGNDAVSPAALLWLPGLTRATAGVTVQRKLWLALLLPSVAVTVTR